MLRLRSVWKGSGSGFAQHRKMTLCTKPWPESVSSPIHLLMPWWGHQDWRKVRQMLLVPPSKSLIEDFDRHCFIPIPTMAEVSASLECLCRCFHFAQHGKGSAFDFVQHRKMTLLAKFWPELVSSPIHLLMPWWGHQGWRKDREMLRLRSAWKGIGFGFI